MKAVIKNGNKLTGEITAPPSKSQALRAALLLALSGEDPQKALTGFESMTVCDDTAAAVRAARSLMHGAEPIYVGASAALLRIILPVSLALFGEAEIVAEPQLIARGHWEAEKCLGVDLTPRDGVISVKKRLKIGEYRVDCSRSSQFLSGLLLALPLLNGESVIGVEGGCVSRGYVDMTVEYARRFGAEYHGWPISPAGGTIAVCHTDYRAPTEPIFPEPFPGGSYVSGDCSYAAFFRAAELMGGRVNVLGIRRQMPQADLDIPDITAQSEVDLTDTPDLLPPLAAAACALSGVTRFTGISRLAYKESDRARAMAALITDLGGFAEVAGDTMTVRGAALTGGVCDAKNDHRLAMAAAMLATVCSGPVVFEGAECASKSAPDFWFDYKKLGGEYEFIRE